MLRKAVSHLPDLFVWFDSLCPSLQFFSHVGMGLPGLNQYKAADKVSCSRTQHSDSAGGEARPSKPSIPSLTGYQLSHCTPHTVIPAWCQNNLSVKCWSRSLGHNACLKSMPRTFFFLPNCRTQHNISENEDIPSSISPCQPVLSMSNHRSL